MEEYCGGPRKAFGRQTPPSPNFQSQVIIQYQDF